MKRVRVLIVDDSPVVRSALVRALGEDPQLEVVGTAQDPIDAWEQLPVLSPDVLTLDVEMPEMDGVTFLGRLMATRPLPVVLVSSLARRSPRLVLDALRAGAVAVIPKPHAAYPIERMLEDLKHTLRGVAHARPGALAPHRVEPANPLPPSQAASMVIAVGSSTGGPTAFEAFARALPAGHPCVLLAQHLPAEFVPRFVARLAETLPSRVTMAQGNEPLTPGHIYVSPATHHLRLGGDRTRPMTELWSSDVVNFHRPSVDVLLGSVATSVGVKRAAGVMLTGMGADGARGLLAMRRAGAVTLAQDEDSCVVYGMPRAAVALGAAQEQHPPGQLARRTIELLAAAAAPARHV